MLEGDAYGDDEHHFHAGFFSSYRAKTNVERFNGYLRHSSPMPLASRLAQSSHKLDAATAHVEMAYWLAQVADARIYGTSREAPAKALKREVELLQTLPATRRADIVSAHHRQRPGRRRPSVGLHRRHRLQHPQQMYDALMECVAKGVAA